MSARVISFSDFAPKQGEYSLLLSDLPGRGVQTLGVLLLDPAADTLYVRLRRDWAMVASDEDAEVLENLEEDLLDKARTEGAAAL
ncbi:MAG: hypothetical protein JO097_09795, partial [Acidobacteriaceae bacterium]|nr:hypothetical protein [Acidobacteriaceae bacterium]